MSSEPDPERLRALEARITALKPEEAKPHLDEHYSQAQHGWRMVIELVAGIVIGFTIGYGLDSLFGTTPIMMVVFILLGFVAGVKTMMATAREMQAEAPGAQPSDSDEG